MYPIYVLTWDLMHYLTTSEKANFLHLRFSALLVHRVLWFAGGGAVGATLSHMFEADGKLDISSHVNISVHALHTLLSLSLACVILQLIDI